MKIAIILGVTVCAIMVSIFGLYIDTAKVEKEMTETKIKFQEENYIQPSSLKDSFGVPYNLNKGLQVNSVDYCRKTIGSSMQPTLWTGNTVCYIEYEENMKNMLDEGMIVSYEKKHDGQTVTHRIKALYPDYLLTQGDNNNGREEIGYEDIRGIAIAILLT